MTHWHLEDEMREKRAREQRDAGKDNPYYKKLTNLHQSDEYKKVDKYKEAVCYGCFKKAACTATIVDACQKCMRKRGIEALLAVVFNRLYGMCSFCGAYDFNVLQINCRLCMTCNTRVRKVFTEYNKKGGVTGTDPFWLSLKKKHGHDWAVLYSGIKTFS